MGNIVRGTSVSNETWPLLDEAALGAAVAAIPSSATRPQADLSPLPPGEGPGVRADEAPPADVLVPLQLWKDARDACDTLRKTTRLGVALKNTDDPAALAADLDDIALITIEFPRFTDGRGYSIARLLRGRYGYRGELRAVGDVLRDQIYYLTRVGFDSFALRDDQDPQAAAAAADFSVAYQASSDQPVPLFRRRVA